MYCPNCSQPQVSDEVQFCSRCGLPLNGMKETIPADGQAKVSQSKTSKDKLSPRQKGVRQGVVLMMLSLIFIPAYILLAALFPANDHLVESSVSDTPFEKISQAVLFTIFMLGLARVLYARLFQPGADLSESDGENGVAELKGSASNYALPPAQNIPGSGFGSWRTNTGEVAQPRNVTERTTKSLEQE
jgi:hypothetical protein